MAEETRATAASSDERRRGTHRLESTLTISDRGDRGVRVQAGPVAAARADANISGARRFASSAWRRSRAINYKDVRLLAQFVAESGKIVPRRLTGVCTPHQRRLSAGHQAGAQYRAAAVCWTRARKLKIVRWSLVVAVPLHGFAVEILIR